MRLAAPRSDARAGGTCVCVCLSEEKLSSGALLGEARVNKAVEFLQRKPMNYGPRISFNEAPGSAASSFFCVGDGFSFSNKTGYVLVW